MMFTFPYNLLWKNANTFCFLRMSGVLISNKFLQAERKICGIKITDFSVNAALAKNAGIWQTYETSFL